MTTSQARSVIPIRTGTFKYRKQCLATEAISDGSFQPKNMLKEHLVHPEHAIFFFSSPLPIFHNRCIASHVLQQLHARQLGHTAHRLKPVIVPLDQKDASILCRSLIVNSKDRVEGIRTGLVRQARQESRALVHVFAFERRLRVARRELVAF
jgi:hypothetical protein